MRAYKFMKPQDAHFWHEKRIRLGSFASYTDLEDGRADDLDGAVRTFLQKIYITDSDQPGNEAAVAAVRAMGIMAARYIDCTFSGRVTVRMPQSLVLCLCNSPENAHFEGMGLTSVFEVPDIEALALWMMGSYPHVLLRARGDPVAYAAREFDALHNPTPNPDPYIKRPEFEPENEYRLCFLTRPDGPTELIVSLLGAPNLIQHLRG